MGGTAILVRRGIVSTRSVPNHFDATAIQFADAGRSVIVTAAYLPASRPLIGEGLTACFARGLPVLMAGELNAKHVDWNSRLTMRQGNSYVIMATRTPVPSSGRNPLPPTHTTPRLLPMSWTS